MRARDAVSGTADGSGPRGRPAPGIRGMGGPLAEALGLLRAGRGDLEALGVSAVGLFGSVARGDHGPDSDLDVVACVASAAAMDDVARAVRRILAPLGRDVDMNFPENLGVGSLLWANAARDAAMAFGGLPAARPRLDPVHADSPDGELVLAAMLAKWPGLRAALGGAMGDGWTPGDPPLPGCGERVLKALGRYDGASLRAFFRHFDDTAREVLGHDRVEVPPAAPGADPRKATSSEWPDEPAAPRAF